MFKRTVYLALAVLLLAASIDARKTSSGRSRGSSSRGTSSRRTNYNPQSASSSYNNQPQPSAPKPETSYSGWQTKAKETPVLSSQTGVSHQSRASGQSHSYPSSQTGLSGNQQPPSYQQAVQQSHSYPQNSKPQQAHTYPQSNVQPVQNNPSPAHTYPQNNPSSAHNYPQQPSNTQSHSYPASGGLSGHSGVGGGYPTQTGGGLSGSAPSHPGGHNYGNNYHPPAQAPPPYPGNFGPGYGSPGYSNPGYGNGGYGKSGFGGVGGFGGNPGGFGGYSNYGGVSRGTSTLTKVGIAGAGVGTLLTGLALWNMARSAGGHRTNIYQDNRGNPIPVPINDSSTAVDPILGELVNCTLTINGANATEVIGIPCAIATSFSQNLDLNKDTSGTAEEAKCTITVVTKHGQEYVTTIPCSIFLNTAKEANVTEPPPLAMNGTDVVPGMGPIPEGVNGSQIMPSGVGVPLIPIVPPNSPAIDPAHQPALTNASPLILNPGGDVPAPECKLDPGAVPDPINPCMPAMGDLSVIPLNTTAQVAPAAA